MKKIFKAWAIISKRTGKIKNWELFDSEREAEFRMVTSSYTDPNPKYWKIKKVKIII